MEPHSAIRRPGAGGNGRAEQRRRLRLEPAQRPRRPELPDGHLRHASAGSGPDQPGELRPPRPSRLRPARLPGQRHRADLEGGSGPAADPSGCHQRQLRQQRPAGTRAALSPVLLHDAARIVSGQHPVAGALPVARAGAACPRSFPARLDDAKRVMDVLGKRLARYGLTLHPDKTHAPPPRCRRANHFFHSTTTWQANHRMRRELPDMP